MKDKEFLTVLKVIELQDILLRKGKSKAAIDEFRQYKTEEKIAALEQMLEDTMSAVAEKKKSKKKKKKKKSRKNKYSETHRQMALSLADWKCEKCGDSEYLHVHHIVYRSEGGTDDISNLMVLCEVCHMKEHEGEPVHNLMLSQYRKRVARRNSQS